LKALAFQARRQQVWLLAIPQQIADEKGSMVSFAHPAAKIERPPRATYT
jgi:hypothetical protein